MTGTALSTRGGFRMRGEQVTRIEALSDVVFIVKRGRETLIAANENAMREPATTDEALL